MKIAIIGARGFLGKKLKEYFSVKNKVLCAGLNSSDDVTKVDATNKEEVENFLLRYKPEVVIDTVALTSSVECEKNLELCEKLNYQTAKNITEVCKKIRSKMVFISSSYVFDGRKGDYNEEDIPVATNQYAKTKLMAEGVVSKLDDFLILRIEMIYGIDNKKIKFGTSTLERNIIDVGYPNQIRNPLFVEDLPKIIETLIKKNQRGIFHVVGPDKITLSDFLKKLTYLIKQENKIKIVNSSNWLLKSPRNPTLDTSKINALGITTTPIEEALKEIKRQIGY